MDSRQLLSLAQRLTRSKALSAGSRSSTTTATARSISTATSTARHTPPLRSSPLSSTKPQLQRCSARRPQLPQRRSLIAAPSPTSGPIMSRRPDRALPDVHRATKRWILTAPIFLGICAASALCIFNYEKTSSSVVAATMYSLRTNPEARAVLGDEVYFRDRFPWIWGELNQVKGRIDIGYGVKGTRGTGYMRFKAVRRSRQALFETVEWSLELEDGTVLRLLDTTKGKDPYGQQVQEAEKSS